MNEDKDKKYEVNIDCLCKGLLCIIDFALKDLQCSRSRGKMYQLRKYILDLLHEIDIIEKLNKESDKEEF